MRRTAAASGLSIGANFHQRLTGFRNDERLSLDRLFDQAGKVGLGLVDIDGVGRLHMD